MKHRERKVMSSDRAKRVARLLDRRLRVFAWLRGVACVYPGGLVSTGTAARVLGVSRQRIADLIAHGRLPTIRMIPNGNSQADVYIPVDALLGAPTPVGTGRPQGWALGQERLRAMGIGVNAWVEAGEQAVSTTDSPDSQKYLDYPGQRLLAFPNPTGSNTCARKVR